MGNTIKVLTRFTVPRYSTTQGKYIDEYHQIRIAIDPNADDHTPIIRKAIAEELNMIDSEIQIFAQYNQQAVAVICKHSRRKHRIKYNEIKENMYHYIVTYKIPISIKLFHGDGINDAFYNTQRNIMYNKRVWLSRGSLCSVIETATDNKYILNSLICQISQDVRSNHNLYDIIYQNIQKLNMDQDVKYISTMIAGYVIEYKNIDLSPSNWRSLKTLEIPPNAIIILRKNLNCKYIKYDEIAANERINLKIYVYSTGFDWRRRVKPTMKREYKLPALSSIKDLVDLLQTEGLCIGDPSNYALKYFTSNDIYDLMSEFKTRKLIQYGIRSGSELSLRPCRVSY